MAFEKKTWLNVPDPNNPPSEAISLNSDELNRIEDGIAASIRRDGDSMDAPLTLRGTYTNDNEAVDKKYVDTGIKRIDLTNCEYTDENTSIGKIPNWSKDLAERYRIVVCYNVVYSSNQASFVTNIDWDSYSYIDTNKYYKIKITSDGMVFVNNKKIIEDNYIKFIFLIPVETLTLK